MVHKYADNFIGKTASIVRLETINMTHIMYVVSDILTKDKNDIRKEYK